MNTILEQSFCEVLQWVLVFRQMTYFGHYTLCLFSGNGQSCLPFFLLQVWRQTWPHQTTHCSEIDAVPQVGDQVSWMALKPLLDSLIEPKMSHHSQNNQVCL